MEKEVAELEAERGKLKADHCQAQLAEVEKIYRHPGIPPSQARLRQLSELAAECLACELMPGGVLSVRKLLKQWPSLQQRSSRALSLDRWVRRERIVQLHICTACC